MSVTLSRDDWKSLDQVVLNLHKIEDLGSFRRFLLEDVSQFLNAMFASWNQHNAKMLLTEVKNSEQFEEKVAPLVPALNETLPSHPLFSRYVDGRKGEVRYVDQVERTRDYVEDEEFYRLPWYQRVAKKLGIEDQILMHVCVKGGRGILLTFHGAQCFTDAELLKAAILRGHILARLYSICDQRGLRAKLGGSILSELRTLLSPREYQVVVPLCQGLSNLEIAKDLGLSPRTVEKHIASVLEKTGEKSRARVIARFGAWFTQSLEEK